MRIRYIFGRAGTGKTSLIFDEIKEGLKNKVDSNFILLVPEQFTLQGEIDLINRIKEPGIMRAQVLSFQRLTYKVFNEVGGLTKRGINELGKLMILRRIFDQYSKELKVYQKAYAQDGFLSSFSSLITEFKRSDISPELLNESIMTIEGDNVLKRKMKDIIFMYTKFNEYMTDKYTDDEDKFNLLVELIDEAEFLQNAEIWVDGFSGFSEQEYRILEKLITKAERTSIALTLDDLNNKPKDRELFEPTKETLNRLRTLAKNHNIKESKTYLKEGLGKRAPELQHLEKEFFSYPYKPFTKKTENIECFIGINQYTEIERVATRIISLVRDNGYRWRDIALVNNAMDIYGLTIKRVFTEYDIPFFIDEKRDILNNPIIKLILSTMNIIRRNFRYEDVFRYIKTDFCNLTKDECEILENYVIRYGIQGNKWFEDFIYGEVDLEEINEIRKTFIAPLVALKEKLKGRNKVAEISTYIFEFLKELDIEEKLEQLISDLRKENKIEYANENTQIWNIVVEVFDQMVEILGDTYINIKEFTKILESGFSEYKIGIIPPTIDQVLVGSLERSRSHEIKALFVVGVNDGILPSSFNDEGLLLDDEKMIIKEKGIPIASDCETRINSERFSIYTALAKPSDYLWVSYALSDNEGKATRPSILIDRLKKIFPKLELKSDVLKGNECKDENQLEIISRPLPTFKYLIENLRLKIDGHQVDNIWDEVYEWYYNNKEWKAYLDNMIGGLFHNNQESYIGEHRAKKLYSTPLRSNISRLETFVNCPFAHFISYGLKPEERREYRVRIPDIGRLFHDSMEKFAKTLSIQELDWRRLGREKCDEIVENIIEEIAPEFENKVLQSSHRYRYLINRLKRISKRAAWTLTEHIKQGEFLPLKHELGFGEGAHNHVPPIIIELPNGEQIILEGRIDRIDILEDEEKGYVKIIDYKSGNKKFSLSEVYHGLQIQLIVYLDAVMENQDLLHTSELHPGGVFYFKLDDPMIESNLNDIENIEKEIMKKLKMDGLIAKDINIARAMDKGLEEEGNSSIIPVILKKDGDFGKYSSVLDEEEIHYLIKHVRNLIIEIAGEILRGNIKIEPCKVEDKTPCQYCQFSSICQFDKNLENNSYKKIPKLKDDEVIEKVKDGGAEVYATVD